MTMYTMGVSTVRIGRRQNFQTNGLSGDKPSEKTGKTGDGKKSKRASASEPLTSTISAYVQMAMDADDVNSAAVAEARALLDSGQLDTPEAISRAAEAILTRGL